MSRLSAPLTALFALSFAAVAPADECATKLNQAISDQNAPLFDELAEDCPDNARVRHNLGVQEANSGNFEKAIRHFEAVLALNPISAASYAHLTALHRHRAVIAYRQALESSLGEPEPPKFAFQPANSADIARVELTLLFEQWWREQCSEDACDAPPVFQIVSLGEDGAALLYRDEQGLRGPLVSRRGNQWQLDESTH